MRANPEAILGESGNALLHARPGAQVHRIARNENFEVEFAGAVFGSAPQVEKLKYLQQNILFRKFKEWNTAKDDFTSSAPLVCLDDGLVSLCPTPVVQSLLKDLQTIQSPANKLDIGPTSREHLSKGVLMEIAVRKLG